MVNFGSGGGTLTTQTLWTSAPALLGIGTVNAKGLVTDVNLLFDSTHGASQTFTMNEPGQNVTVNLDLSNPSTAGDFGVGYTGSGFGGDPRWGDGQLPIGLPRLPVRFERRNDRYRHGLATEQ